MTLGGTARWRAPCQPARSSTIATGTPEAGVAAKRSGKTRMAAVETSGSAGAKSSPVAGRTAPDRWAHP